MEAYLDSYVRPLKLVEQARLVEVVWEVVLRIPMMVTSIVDLVALVR